jgi:hypothetical protein
VSTTRHYVCDTNQVLANHTFITRSLALSLAPKAAHIAPTNRTRRTPFVNREISISL